MTLASSAKKPSKTFDELMSTLIDFFAFITNGLKINNLTQETLLGPAFKLLKGTRSTYAELEYDFEECYTALSEKLDWENPEGGDYPFDLTKPLPLVMSGNHQKLPVDYFFNNDLKYCQGIEDMVPVKVAYNKHAVKVMKKHRYGYIEEIVVRRADNDLYKFKEGDFLCDDVSDFAIALRMFTRSLVIQKDLPRDIPLDSVVVLRYEKRSKSENKGKVPTEMELVLEQTQQVMRTASTAAKPCQEDSLKFYLITYSIYTDQRETMVIETVFDEVTKTLSSISVDYH
ncbi:hypothetical protein Tco_0269332 [Tanacetum coccineum]